jgi:uncharacterized small protein (DUF1192 family)
MKPLPPSKRVNALREELGRIYDEHANDPEVAHAKANNALIAYIGDPGVKELYERIPKWYA